MWRRHHRSGSIAYNRVHLESGVCGTVDCGHIELGRDGVLDVFCHARPLCSRSLDPDRRAMLLPMPAEHTGRLWIPRKALNTVNDSAKEPCYLVFNPACHSRVPSQIPSRYSCRLQRGSHQRPDAVYDGRNNLRQLRHQLRDGLNDTGCQLDEDIHAGFKNGRQVPTDELHD